MSDAILPPLPSSSSVEDSKAGKSPTSSSSGNDVYPFLVHSQASVTNGEPPEVDNGRLARQKRRRTSPEDQAFLEAEYKRNPKPDKAARMEIVKHVALGEKEVQIWFQNRRQTTRRKSRPLLPHEIAAFGLGGMAALSSATISGTVIGNQVYIDTEHASRPGVSPSDERSYNGHVEGSVNTANNPHPGPLEPDLARSQHLMGPTALPSITALEPKDPKSSPESASSTFSLSQTSSQPLPSIGYLSNRRIAPHLSNSSPSLSQIPVFSTPSSASSYQPASCPEKITSSDNLTPSSSQVRLSLSLDGKAELVPAGISPQKPEPVRHEPSGPNVPQRRAGGLQRSQSAVSFGPLPKKTSTPTPFIPRMPRGRSRDARTWEFCCDTEARDELTTQAENESSGSAVAAISLLRSTSNTALKPNLSKRNAPPPKAEVKHGKRPKLGRANSSLARLQSTGHDHAAMPHGKDKDSSSRSPSGDSDKENWAPANSASSTQPRRPLPSAPQKHGRRRVLGDSTAVSSSSKHARHNSKGGTAVPKVFEDNEEREVSDDVERFMRGDVSPSKKGDFDCIQGLLSLSQGNWR